MKTKKQQLIKDLMNVLFDSGRSNGGYVIAWTFNKLSVQDLKYLYFVKTGQNWNY